MPDRNLAAHVQRHTDKVVIPWEGNCYVHQQITPAAVANMKAMHPDAKVMVHPECRPDVVDLVNRPPPPPAPPTPAVPATSHAVTADDYPGVSIRLQEQGTVAIKYTISTDGSVTECAVVTGSGKPRLDDAACTMVKKRWKFKPATQDGKPVAVSLPAEVIFALK